MIPPLFGYRNETLEALAASEILELDDDARKAIVHDMQAVLAKDAPTYRSFTTRAMSYDTWRISTYDEWMNMYERHVRMHSKLSFLVRDGIAAQR